MLTEILKLEFIMAMLIAVGAVMKTRGKITDEGQACLTNIVIDVIIPCNIIMSFIGQGNLDKLMESLPIIGLSALMMFLSVVIGKICFRRMDPEIRKLAEYGLVNSNALFIGLPVVLSLFGNEAGMLQSLYMIFVRSFVWSYGLGILAGKGSSLQETLKKNLTNHCMLAAAVGILLMLTGFELPEVLTRTFSYFSSCLMAMSMLLIGCVLSGLDIGHVFRADVWWFNLVRLIAAPAAALAVCLLLRTRPLIAAVVVIMMAMPSASMTAVLAPRYHCNQQYGGLVVATSTIMSIVTIPVWYLVLRLIYGL